MALHPRNTLGAIGIAVTCILGGSLLTSMLPWATGRTPAMAALRAREHEREASPELLASIRERFDLPASPWESFGRWFTHTLRGNLGHSWIQPEQPALGMALHGLGVTATLTGLALALAVGISVLVVLPRLRAQTKGTAASKASATASVLATLAAVPDFVLAVVLLWCFALTLRWFPVAGWSTPTHMVLPVTAFAVATAGTYGRALLLSVENTIAEGWMTTWRINGVRGSTIIRFALWRSFAPTVPLLALAFSGLISATAAIEITFNMPGFGRTVVQAAHDQDIPVLQAAVLTVLVLGTLLGLFAHLIRTAMLAPVLRSEGQGAVGTDAHITPPRTWWVWLAAIPLCLGLAGVLRPLGIDPSNKFAGVSLQHPLGTDGLGRDLWARLGAGAWFTIGTAVAITAACALIGLILAHAGRWALQLGDALNALPAVLVGLVLAGILGASTWTATIAVLLVGWIPLTAHGAAVAQEARSTAHYRYAKLMGASRWHLLRHHELPATAPAIIRHAAGRVAHNAIALTGLAYLGVGAEVGSPEWGIILNESTRYFERAPWMALGPTVLLVCLGVVGVALTDSQRMSRKWRQRFATPGKSNAEPSPAA